MLKKILISLFILGILCALFYLYIEKWHNYPTSDSTGLSPVSQETNPFKKLAENISDAVEDKKEDIFGDIINILIIGTDTSASRRADGQMGFNTDTMILLSMNIEKNILLLTSVPRDLWINGNKINALYTVSGYKTLKDAFEKISGQEVDAYVQTDFDGFKWIVESFGGIPVDVQRTFTDYTFPNNTDTDIMTVTFSEGPEVLTGDRALIFARSRKGDNGEGSDLMRARRQHLILQGMVKGISQPESRFWPMDVPKFYRAITEHVETSLSLEDVRYLWDFYAEREKYSVESFVVDDTYIYHPGLYPDSPYHAWVFISRDGTFEQLQKDIQAKLDGTFVDPYAEPLLESTTPSQQ